MGTIVAVVSFFVISSKHPQPVVKEYPLYDSTRYLPVQGPMTEEAALAVDVGIFVKIWRILTLYPVRSFIYTWTISPIFDFIHGLISKLIEYLW